MINEIVKDLRNKNTIIEFKAFCTSNPISTDGCLSPDCQECMALWLAERIEKMIGKTEKKEDRSIMTQAEREMFFEGMYDDGK